MSSPAAVSPFSVGNVRWFLVFRVLANARYYYPVLAALFLDLGLTLTQFNLLNAIWAVTIVLAEVPSGALADLVGRRTLVLAAAVLMVVEMAVLLVAPVGGGWTLFWLVVVNRIASGLGEASASGADEAIAYDTLQAQGLAAEWPRVLERLTKLTSVGFFVAMIVGGLVYDLRLANAVWGWIGGGELTRADIVKLPIWLTLGHALLVTLAAARLKEPAGFVRQPMSLAALRGTFAQMAKAANWTFGHRFVLFVILAGVLLDCFARQQAVLSAEYLRIIGFSPALFGFIFAGSSLLGLWYARFAKYLATQRTPRQVLFILAGIMVLGLSGLGFAFPYVGLIPTLLTTSLLSIVGFLQSHYLNREVEPAMRATVLSFRGLAINVGYGAIGLLHIGILAGLKTAFPAANDDTLFTRSLFFFPGLFLLGLGVLSVAGTRFIRRPEKLDVVG